MSVVGFESDPPAVWRRYSEVAGALAFDVGANGGMTARLLAEHFDQVVACEPAVESFGHLCSMTPENVTPLNVAVSAEVGEVTLEERTAAMSLGELVTADAGPALRETWGEATGTRSVKATTIDELAEEYGDPDFIKVDTEGHEQRVIEGGSSTIRRADPRLLIEIHDAVQGDWVLNELGGRFELIRHPAYATGSDRYLGHYWLIKGMT